MEDRDMTTTTKPTTTRSRAADRPQAEQPRLKDDPAVKAHASHKRELEAQLKTLQAELAAAVDPARALAENRPTGRSVEAIRQDIAGTDGDLKIVNDELVSAENAATRAELARLAPILAAMSARGLAAFDVVVAIADEIKVAHDDAKKRGVPRDRLTGWKSVNGEVFLDFARRHAEVRRMFATSAKEATR
jgi:hypothetical protein